MPQLPERRLRFVLPVPQSALQELLSSGCIEEIFGEQKNSDISIFLEEYHFEKPRRIRIVLRCGNSRREQDIFLTEQFASTDRGALSQRQKETLHNILRQHCEKNTHHAWLSGNELSKDVIRSRSERPDKIPIPHESSYWNMLKKSGVLQILQQRYCPDVTVEDMELSIPARYLATKSLSMFLVLSANGEDHPTSISITGKLQHGGAIDTSQLDAVIQVFDALLPPPISPKPYFASGNQQKTTKVIPLNKENSERNDLE